MKTYQQVFDLVAEYCNSDLQTLPLFADGWNRWPTARNAHALLTRIESISRSFERTGRESIANALREAMIAIRNNM